MTDFLRTMKATNRFRRNCSSKGAIRGDKSVLHSREIIPALMVSVEYVLVKCYEKLMHPLKLGSETCRKK